MSSTINREGAACLARIDAHMAGIRNELRDLPQHRPDLAEQAERWLQVFQAKLFPDVAVARRAREDSGERLTHRIKWRVEADGPWNEQEYRNSTNREARSKWYAAEKLRQSACWEWKIWAPETEPEPGDRHPEPPSKGATVKKGRARK